MNLHTLYLLRSIKFEYIFAPLFYIIQQLKTSRLTYDMIVRILIYVSSFLSLFCDVNKTKLMEKMSQQQVNSFDCAVFLC